MKRFSVIVPSFNRADLLKQTLELVWEQTYSDYEVIVVDDGSTDNTREYLRSIASKVRIEYQANAGPGSARNTGASVSQGEYLAFLDSDDLWLPWTLRVFSDLINRHSRPAILSGSVQCFREKGELSVSERPLSSVYYPDHLAGGAVGHIVIGSGVVVIRREAFLRSEGFTTRRINAEDHDLILRMGVEPGFVQVLSPPTLGYRQHSDNATRNLRKSFEGLEYLIHQERIGAYPGGAFRAGERRRLITRHVRPAAIECLRSGMRSEAWSLYGSTCAWHISAARWKFLFGFPVMAVVEAAWRNIPVFGEAKFRKADRACAHSRITS